MNDDGQGQRYFGKYRGSVVDNVDPEQRGRIQVEVPDLQGTLPLTWAEACLPFAGPAGAQMGFFAVPPPGTAVWVEFEAGDPDYPIWTGCLFDASVDVPAPAQEPGGLPHSRVVVQTQGQNSFSISDVPGEGLTLRAASGASIVVNEEGITISNAKGATIKLTGNLVSVNNGALEIT
jgi:uncharacterized protein involved in type VI secretion and phage assembly